MGRPVARPRRPARRRGCAAPGRRPVRPAVPAAEPRRAEHRPARLGDGARRRRSIRAGSTTRRSSCTCSRPSRPGRTSRRTSPRASSWSRSELAGVAAAWWLGRKAYGTLAGFVAAAATAVATTHVAYSRMAVTDVPLTLGVTVALALMVSGRHRAGGHRGRARGEREVSGRHPARAAGRRCVGEMAAARDRRRARARRLRRHEPVRRPAGSGDGRERRVRACSAAAREGWLGFEHDHVGADRVRRAALGRRSGRCSSSRRRARSSRSSTARAPISSSRSFVLVYFARTADDRRALRPLRAAARPGARRARRPPALARAGDAAPARRPADVGGPARRAT